MHECLLSRRSNIPLTHMLSILCPLTRLNLPSGWPWRPLRGVITLISTSFFSLKKKWCGSLVWPQMQDHSDGKAWVGQEKWSAVKTCTTDGIWRWRWRGQVRRWRLVETRWHRVSQQANGKTESERETDTVPLPEHLWERGVAVIRPRGRRGAREREGGQGGKRKGLITLRKDRRVTGKGLKRRGVTSGRDFRYKAMSKLTGKLGQQ